ncbi:MAG: DUF1788 domain-containing protein [Prevotella sp.]
MNNNIDMDILFEEIFRKLISPDFGKNLVGELPLFIQPIPVTGQTELDGQLERLVSRLGKKGKTAIIINLYELAMQLLEEEGVLETILEEESDIPQEDISSTLDSILDIKSVIIPRIQDKICESNPDFMFITGVGRIYPFIRSHGILNNIEELAMNNNLILFFPGEYNNLQLFLFGTISDENYYRGHNLNEIKVNNVTV